MELLTKKQQQRKERNERIAATFKAMKASYPEASNSLIMKEIVDKCGFNVGYDTVRTALIATQTIKVQHDDKR